MRVAVVLEQCWHRVPGGSTRATLDTIAAVQALGTVDQVGVAAWHRAPPEPPWVPSIEWRRLPLPRPLLYDAWQSIRHPRVERATGPVDVVHATAHVAPAAKAPMVATVHDLHFLHEPDHFTARGVRVFRRFLGLVRAEAAIVVVPSMATRDDCEVAGIEPSRLRVVPWGVDPVPVTAEQVAQVRQEYGITKPYVLAVGTQEPRKNLGRLVDAFGRLGRADLDLVLVGPEGWGNEPTGRVRRLGFIPAPHRDALYAGAQVVAYPSLREGFGLPVLEAMAQGAAVVTSSGTSTAEVAGDTGVLVDPLDVDALAGAIARLLDDRDLAGRLGAAAAQRARTFTWERTAAAMVAAYEAAR